jgi:hypothetical protein
VLLECAKTLLTEVRVQSFNESHGNMPDPHCEVRKSEKHEDTVCGGGAFPHHALVIEVL